MSSIGADDLLAKGKKTSAAWYRTKITAISGGIAAFIAFLGSLDWLSEKLHPWLNTVAIETTQGGAQLKEGWAFGMTAGVFFLILFLAGSLFFAKTSFSSHAAAQNRSAAEKALVETRETLNRTIDSARRISNQIYPPKKFPGYIYESSTRTFIVEKNGDTLVRRVDTIKAGEEEVLFYEMHFGAEEEASPVEYLNGLNFSVTDASKTGQVTFLQTENKARYKRVAIFFLPSIKPNEGTRTIETSYTWPGMHNRLLTKGEEDWVFELKSLEDVPELRIQFYFHPDLGKIHCDAVGRPPGNASLDETVSERGWAGWDYKVEGAPGHSFKYILYFKAEA